MKQVYFVAGTDTGVGKTWVSCSLLQSWRRLGKTVLGIKPVASGVIEYAGSYVNQDALMLAEFSSVKLPYHHVNPFMFAAPVSPHLAAELAHRPLSVESILAACQPALFSHCDRLLIEGVGGWLAPISNTKTMADVAKGLNYPIILVVGLRLGCLNHALLTYEAILNQGLVIAGWVGNQIESEMLYLDKITEFLAQKIHAPCLGIVPYLENQKKPPK